MNVFLHFHLNVCISEFFSSQIFLVSQTISHTKSFVRVPDYYIILTLSELSVSLLPFTLIRCMCDRKRFFSSPSPSLSLSLFLFLFHICNAASLTKVSSFSLVLFFFLHHEPCRIKWKMWMYDSKLIPCQVADVCVCCECNFIAYNIYKRRRRSSSSEGEKEKSIPIQRTMS